MLVNYVKSRDFMEIEVRNTGSLLQRPTWTGEWIKRFIAREKKIEEITY